MRQIIELKGARQSGKSTLVRHLVTGLCEAGGMPPLVILPTQEMAREWSKRYENDHGFNVVAEWPGKVLSDVKLFSCNTDAFESRLATGGFTNHKLAVIGHVIVENKEAFKPEDIELIKRLFCCGTNIGQLLIVTEGLVI